LRRVVVHVLGGALGVLLGLAVWYGLAVLLMHVVVDCFPSSSELGLPSDASVVMFCFSLLVFPVAGLAGGWVGLRVTRRMFAVNEQKGHSAPPSE
jgi:hypothetical protein